MTIYQKKKLEMFGLDNLYFYFQLSDFMKCTIFLVIKKFKIKGECHNYYITGDQMMPTELFQQFNQLNKHQGISSHQQSHRQALS